MTVAQPYIPATVLCDFGIMRYEYNCTSFRVKFLKQDKYLKRGTGVEISGGFVGKENGFAQLKDEMGDSSVLFDGLDKNPLPDAYEVSLKDTDKFEDTVKRISELPNVLHVRENRQLANQLAGLRNTVS